MSLKLITAPVDEPVTLEEAKLHLRVDGDDENGYISGRLALAVEDVETITNSRLITQTWEWVLDAFPLGSQLRLPLFPVQSVTSIKYTPYGGIETTFNSANYLVDTEGRYGRIVLKRTASWPSDDLIDANGVRFRFVCGYGDAAGDVPRAVRQAILLLAGHYYENREATQEKPVELLPMGVDALLANYRDWSMAV